MVVVVSRSDHRLMLHPAEFHIESMGKLVHYDEAEVVPGVLVVLSRISQADDQEF